MYFRINITLDFFLPVPTAAHNRLDSSLRKYTAASLEYTTADSPLFSKQSMYLYLTEAHQHSCACRHTFGRLQTTTTAHGAQSAPTQSVTSPFPARFVALGWFERHLIIEMQLMQRSPGTGRMHTHKHTPERGMGRKQQAIHQRRLTNDSDAYGINTFGLRLKAILFFLSMELQLQPWASVRI